MPNIIVPSKEVAGRAQGRVRVVLVVSRQSTSDELVFALANAMPALLVLVHSSNEALEVTEAIKPDAFVLDSTFEELNGGDLYERLQAQSGFATIPAILIGQLSPEQRRSMAKRKVVNLSYPFEPSDLQSALETLLNIPHAPVSPGTIEVIEHNSSSVA
jgi:CheY-like chemotaxis protein